MYLGGYAIECALISHICYRSGKNNFKDTRAFAQGLQGSSLHSLAKLISQVPEAKRAIMLDRTGTYRLAWNTIERLWQKDELRYWDKQGDQGDSTRFLEAMETLHQFLLRSQGEPS